MTDITRERERAKNLYQQLERSTCCVEENDTLEHLHTFKNFPVFMGCSNQSDEVDIKSDMSWWIGKSSGAIQLKKLLPLEILYPESHGAGEVGALWDKHHSAFAHFISKFSPKEIFEIGGAHGILEKKYQSFNKIPWVILEPNPHPVDGCHAKFIKGFFDSDFIFEDDFDTLIHSHVFEHIYNPNSFMKQLSNFVGEGKNLIFSLPNMKEMLTRKYTNCINFEHTLFLTEEYIEYFLTKYGFRVSRKEYFMDDHSIFYSAVKDSSTITQELPSYLYEENKSLYLDYLKYHENLIKELNTKIEESSKPIYLFGAHVFAQYLISFGLNTNKIICLLDNDKNKHERRLYGTKLIVQSPACLKNVEDPIVILKAGVYNNEIKTDILKNINSKTMFWE
jgi:SAM-dependent methyltransferase